MSELLKYSMFQDVLLPKLDDSSGGRDDNSLVLQKLLRYKPTPGQLISDSDLVVFDFETTGLDSKEDRIVEIGAIRWSKGEKIGEFSTLVASEVPLTEQIEKLTGITNQMLADQPTIDTVMPEFIGFFDGAILVAHNAEFDMGFLNTACQRLGYDLDWPAFCTLKLARQLLPELESKNLDSLAAHFELTFEARHRSIGDVKVTSSVMERLLAENTQTLGTWGQLQTIAAVK